MKPSPPLLRAAWLLSLLLAACHRPAPLASASPSSPVPSAPAPNPAPSTPAPAPTPPGPDIRLFPSHSPTIAPTPVFEAKLVEVENLPTVFEFEVDGPGGSARVRAVALSCDGKFLSVAAPFAAARAVFLPGRGQSGSSPGWLARDASWMVFTLRGAAAPAVTAAASRLDWGDGPYLIPLPTSSSPNRAVIGIAAAPPPGGVEDDASFWICTAPEELLPGTPVLNAHKFLLGLVAEVRPDLRLARVVRAGAPLPAFARAVHAGKPLAWGAAGEEHPLPFADARIDPATVSAILETESGDKLAALCDALLRREENSPLAWYLAVLGYTRAGKEAQALSSARMLTQLAPQDGASWLLYGSRLAAQGQNGEALDAYQTALDRGSPPRETMPPMALALMRLGHYDAELDQLQTLTDKEPDDYDAWMALGAANRSLGRPAPAVRAYLAAIRLDPQSVEAWTAIAACYDGLKEWPASVQAYGQLSLLAPGDGAVWYDFGLALIHAGRPAEAADCMRWVVKIDPKDRQGWLQLSRLDAGAGRNAEALEECRRALAADGDYAPAWQQLGALRIQAGDSQEAQQAWEQAVRLDPNDLASWRNLVRLSYEKGGAASAAPVFARLEKVSPALAASLRGEWGGDVAPRGNALTQ